jgi:hypothetical protein
MCKWRDCSVDELSPACAASEAGLFEAPPAAATAAAGFSRLEELDVLRHR